MNKTAILSFIIDEVVLKARNVSINMRKRIHWMLKHMEITVKKYDERALVLNGWVRITGGWFRIENIEEIKKGVSNYWLYTQEQLERVMHINNEVRCSCIRFSLVSPIEIELVEYLRVDQINYDIYSKCSINKVKHLSLEELSTNQIKSFLTKDKIIDRLEISKSSLEGIDLNQSRIKQFSFSSVSFKEPVFLPIKISELKLFECISPNLIIAHNVNSISFNSRDSDIRECKKLLKTLKGVKVAGISESLTECLIFLPSTAREIQISKSWDEVDNLAKITKHFPYFIKTWSPFPIELNSKTKLRMINPIISNSEERFNLRRKKMLVYPNNATQLNSHPELFEKLEYIGIDSDEFNFDVLPNEIKRIDIDSEVNKESISLNRLKKERE